MTQPGSKTAETVDDAIAEFLTDLANAGRSHHTVRAYRADLTQFARHHTGPVAEIDAAVLRGFFSAIAGQAASTRARKRAAVSEFLAWARRNEWMHTDPMALIERVSVPTRLPRGVEPDSVQRVLAAIPKKKLRDRVLFGLIATTGLRASEALGTYVEDLALIADDEHVTVTAKGGRQRTILLDDPAFLALLRRYLRATGYTRGPLFRAGKNHIGGPLRYSSAESLWRGYCQTAGERIGLQQLRHTHATELINDGVPVETVRKRLGHKKISSTLLYAEKSDRAADDEIRAWRRRRPTPASTPPRAPAAPAVTTKPEPSQRDQLACPSCRHTPRTREEALQQREDLAITWLHYGPYGELTSSHHCAGCAPASAVTDLACTTCEDGPLLTSPTESAPDPGPLPTEVQRWLHDHGWQTAPELLCPTHVHQAG